MAHILTHLETDVKILVDTHADENTLGMLRKEYKIDMAKYNIIGNYSRERGVMILIKKSCGYTSSNLKLLDSSDTIQFDLNSPDGMVYNVVAIYTPDGERNAPYWTTLHGLLTRKHSKQILIGDFNTTLDPILDRCNYSTDNHCKGRQVINSWLKGEEYLDAYRYLYPETKGYSWRWDGNRRSGKDLKGRIDHCLVSPDLIEKVIDVNYQYNTASDHASISVEIETDEEVYGKGTFRVLPNIQNEKI